VQHPAIGVIVHDHCLVPEDQADRPMQADSRERLIRNVEQQNPTHSHLLPGAPAFVPPGHP
jgi:hypothetical protein